MNFGVTQFSPPHGLEPVQKLLIIQVRNENGLDQGGSSRSEQ